jgi:hypothetical protein
MVKVTFTLDDDTVTRLRRSAERLGKPQSAVVRDAINDYAGRVGRLSDEERRRMLGVLDDLAVHPARGARAVRAELESIRRARRQGGRRTRG